MRSRVPAVTAVWALITNTASAQSAIRTTTSYPTPIPSHPNLSSSTMSTLNKLANPPPIYRKWYPQVLLLALISG